VDDAPNEGKFAGTVTSRPPVVVLKESYHPRWRATVDGREVPTQMVALSLVAVAVPAGDHRVVFQYVPYSGWNYALLFALGGVTLIGLVMLDRRASRMRGSNA
jgi:uncharacterized membrane protein YfhO